MSEFIFCIGEPVVCVDDQYSGWVLDIYKQLPIKEKIYHVRGVGFGRAEIADSGTDSLVISLLFEEIVNPTDPYFKGGKEELAFDSRHFMPLKEYEARTMV